MSRTVTEGRPWPLGVTPDAHGVNVAVWAPEATQLLFCLFDEGGEQRIELPYRDGEVWHAHISGVDAGSRYGLRADGPHRPDEGLRFNSHKLLIDPYARGLDAELRWNPLMLGHAPGQHDDLVLDTRDSASVTPKGLVPGLAHGPDPAANRPHHTYADLVVYEAHLKGMTAAHPGVPAELRGTYEGFAHPAVVEHLVSLGVNAVELLPVQAFLDDQYLVGKGLRNYWGYQPISWFAPEPRYARHDADGELRHLVHTLHEAGIEVIVDVVFNHTGEGDELGPTLSLRGLHNTGYYRLLDGGRHYVNDTGTGNTLAVDRPMVMRLVLDSLRHWVQHYGIDGFRFDLAATVGRTEHGFDAGAAFFQALRQDPVLAGTKLIAEPWDIGPGGYQLGHFPHPWREWNDRFRDGVRRAWRTDVIGEVELGARLLGSAGLFDHSGRGATSSVNFITAHDGFTLADLVSYSRKHNEANGEENRDGHDHNLSDNFGVEGPTDDETVLLARSRRARSMLATLLMSQGVPMLLAGDEFGNSQQGNNNVYAQDNPTGWLDWSSPDWALIDLVRTLVSVRKRHPVLRQREFLHGNTRADGRPDVAWRLANGETPTHDDWHDPACQTITAEIRAAASSRGDASVDDAVLIMFNMGDDVEVRLPETGDGRSWCLEVDTARHGIAQDQIERPDPEHDSGLYLALAQSVVVFAAE